MPKRVTSCAPTTAETIAAIPIGTKCTPASSALSPCTCCRYSAVRKNMPRKAPPLSASAIAETLSPRTRNSRSGTSGSAARASTTTNAASRISAGAEQPEHLGRAPAGRVGADHAADEREQAAGAEHRAGEVEAARAAAAALGDEHGRGEHARRSRRAR